MLFTNKDPPPFSVPVSAEHPQTPNDNKLQFHLPHEGLEGHAGLGQDLRGEDLSGPRCSVY